MKNVLIILLCLCFTSYAFASKEDALLYFNKGQEALNNKNYDLALTWLTKATDERSYDGDIAIETGEKKYQWIKTPRGRQRVEVANGDAVYKAYFPNRLISEIQYTQAKLQEVERVENARLAKAKAVNDLLRQKYSNPPKLLITYHLSGDNVIEAKEQTKLRVVVENAGGFDASSVNLVFSGLEDIELAGSRFIGEIATGGSITQSFDLIADKNIASGTLNLGIMVQEKDGFDSQTHFANFKTIAYQKPQLKVIRESVATIGTNLIEASYTIVNIGRGKAFDVVSHFRITDQQGGIFFNNESDSQITIGDLQPNQNKEIKIQFFANNRIKTNEALPFQVKVTEQDFENNISQSLALAMPQRSRNTQYAYGAPPVSPVPLITNYTPVYSAASVDVNIPQGLNKQDHSVALVIGNGNYAAIDNVDFAEKDALTVSEYAKKTLGYQKVNLIKNMKSRGFTRQFGTEKNGYKGKLYKRVALEASRKKNPAVFVYYSGHGAPSLNENGSAYFVPTDIENMNYLSDEGYSIADFYASIRKLPTNNVTIVIDSCFSGSSNGDKLLYKNISPAMLKTRSTNPTTTIENATIFTSASANEVSNWYAPGEHSLFTYHFLAGLSGKADSNNDAKISLDELNKYIQYNVSDHTLENDLSEQTPNLIGNNSKIIATLKRP